MKLSELKAYELLEERELTDICSMGYVMRHKKSGARIVAVSNDDENKVFYIGFRTPAEDSTGVPHIIEHTVLCGSDKYPVKDPFVELVKGSLNTFLNAMTYPDKTVYPVASCNQTDFQNLMSVYMDAVLHPNIYRFEEIFKQEGWHYELSDKDAPITINGVVYNEMKGAFSSPDDVLEREIMHALFPDTTYAHNSGGDPDEIPKLTYEQYLEFHRRYYHPSNAYIYLYGDMDIAEKLLWMDEEYLSSYTYSEPSSAIGMQTPFTAPTELVREYPIASGESEENNTYLSYNLVIGTVLDKKLYQAFDILDYALLSAPGAPLRQALIDAGIGMDIVGGYDAGTMQPTFSIVAKNTNLSEKERFLAVIQETLRQQVHEGIDKKALLAGINSAEFRFREADYGHFPNGLVYGLQCLNSWLYDEKQPFLHLEALETYQFLKEQVYTDYFEQLIETYLLKNTHAAVVAAVPRKGLHAKKDEALTKQLAAYKASLSDAQIEQLIADTQRLHAYQEEPSAKEELAKLPMLHREDLEKKAVPLSNHEYYMGDTKLVHHLYHTNGIDYLTLLFDIKDMTAEELPYLGILKMVLGCVDTKSYSYAELANEINIHTGGMSASLGIYPYVQDRDNIELMFELRTKVLSSKLSDAMRLFEEMILTSKLSDEKRLYELLAQTKSRLQMALSSAGHSAAATRAMSYFSRSAYYQDAVGGISFYRVIAEYEEHYEEKKDELIRKLSELVQRIFTAERLLGSITCDKSDYAAAEQAIAGLKEKLYHTGEPKLVRSLPKLTLEKHNEGFMDASQVQYVARAGNYRAHGYTYHGALKILKVIMGYDYLWTNIRVIGGAYGCMNNYMRNGDTYFVSYRDPKLSETNEVYSHIAEYVGAFDADDHEMTKYIIGTISDMDVPLNPSAKGVRSMTAYLQGLTYEDIQRERDEVLGASAEDIRALKDLLASVLLDEALCVIGNEEELKNKKEMFLHLESLY